MEGVIYHSRPPCRFPLSLLSSTTSLSAASWAFLLLFAIDTQRVCDSSTWTRQSLSSSIPFLLQVLYIAPMSSPDSPTTSMSRYELDDLLERLRRSDAHHSRLAAESRGVSQARPELKARKHAQALRLSISVEAASRLDHRCISTIPLPLLDLSPSPPNHAPAVQITKATAVPEIVAPIPRYPSHNSAADQLTRPAAPGPISVQQSIVSLSPGRHILPSTWSASTTGTGQSDETDDDDEEDDDIELEPPQVGVRYPSSNDHENFDILVSPDDGDMDHPQVSLSPVAIQEVELPDVVSHLPDRIPRQAVQQRQEQESLLQSADPPALAHLSSGSDSSQSSLELVTPVCISFPFFLTQI